MKLTLLLLGFLIAYVCAGQVQASSSTPDRSLPLSDLTIVSFDVETTGLNPETERIVEYGAIKFVSDRILAETNWLINPRRHIQAGARRVHGITHDMVKRQRIFRTVYPEILQFVEGSVLLAHNARFDVRFFSEEIKRNEKAMPDVIVVDTLPLFRKWFPDAPAYNLTALAEYLGISGGNFHRGMDDAAYVVSIFQIGMKKNHAPGTLGELIEQANGFYRFEP